MPRSERCHTHRGVFIPGCMGAAVYGKHRCTCPPRGASIEDRLRNIERNIGRILELLAAPAEREGGQDGRE